MKKIKLILLSLFMVLSMASCASEAATNTVSESPPPSSEPKEQISQQDESKTQEEEQRVVALSVAIVEILDALDVTMVGIPTSSYTLPDSVKEATTVGNPYES